MPPALAHPIVGTAAQGNYALAGPPKTTLFEPTSWLSEIIGAVLGQKEGYGVTATVSSPYNLATCSGALSSPQLLELHRQLRALDHLQKGWDSYDAEPPNSKAMKNAHRVFEALVSHEMAYLPTRISASVEGGVGFVFRSEDQYADIEFFNSGEILTAASDSSGRSNVRQWSDGETRAMIDWTCRNIE